MSSADMRRAWRERPVSTLFATGLGIGMMPFAPGTWGSVEGLGIGLGIARLLHRSPGLFWISCIVGLAVAGFGVLVSTPVEAVCAAPDPGPIVIDEVAGQLLASAPAFLVAPAAGGGKRLGVFLGISFLLFRLFDVWKPGPIRRLQNLPGGLGIVADDVAAGIAAGALTLAIGWAFR